MLLRLVMSLSPLIVAAAIGMVFVYTIGEKEGDDLIIPYSKLGRVAIVTGSVGMALGFFLTMLVLN